ncbi:hypothetical protein [Hyalangium versicolor]|uniref:hypothetical protein n=1 Tax=Hyalangium versicolor TaxID=2861190 RepID=UPI001CCB7C7A|nr:hypothetical protein [Hyalangium versicolor]
MSQGTWKKALFVGAMGLGLAASAQSVDEQIGGARQFLDPEFKGAAAVYQDDNRMVWQAPVDPVTGVIDELQRRLIDNQATPLIESFQGPEWVRGSDRILYTKTTDATPNLWLKRPNLPPVQLTQPPAKRYLLTGILTSQLSTKVTYRREETLSSGEVAKGVYWLDTSAPTVEHLLPGANLGVAPVSWIPGSEDLVYCQKQGQPAVNQLVRLSTATDTLTTLTSDLDEKEDSFAFQAAEANQALRYAAVVNGGTLRVYLDVNGDGRWGGSASERVDLRPPSDLPYMFSPETFQARDSQGALRTWFVVVMRTSATAPGPQDHGEVWVLGMNGTSIRVDGGTPSQPRQPADPEYTQGQSEIFVYYNNGNDLALWRSHTGLAVP